MQILNILGARGSLGSINLICIDLCSEKAIPPSKFLKMSENINGTVHLLN